MARRSTRRRGRLGVIALVVVTTMLGGPAPLSSSAAPSRAELAAAKQELTALQHRFEAVVERFNEARYELARGERQLEDARTEMRAADEEAALAVERLTERAVASYMGMGSQWEGILTSDSVVEFSDRLEFIGALGSADADLAAEAENARQNASWAAARYQEAVEESRARLSDLEASRQQMQRLLDAQEALYERLRIDYEEFIAAQRAAIAEDEAQDATSTTGGSTDGGGPGGTFVPPPDASAAQVAVQAAYSAIGAPYVAGSSNPSVGLDCSGVTVYAWGQAGVSLPHSAAAQYAGYPRVPLSAVQPGDLIYYGNFGPHIAIYVGGGQIIHATSPSPGGQTRLDSMYGYDDPWGAVRVT